MKKVLVVEDDAALSELIGIHLGDLGLEVDRTPSAVEGEQKAMSGAYDLLVLDLMLPDGDGMDICRKLRMEKMQVPIIMLTAKSEEIDKETYQTVFAQNDGSIAAPTAGLHFTDEILDKLKAKGIKIRELTLHVGPGTFLPVSTDNVSEHKMHSEMFSIDKTLLQDLKSDLEEERKIVCVGTTSIRTMESLFWAGNNIDSFSKTGLVNQWSPYDNENNLTPIEAINQLLENSPKEIIQGKTELIIVSGYKFKFTDGLFTNYHVPKSTLLLLVSAFVGDMWTEIYDSALSNDYRFLSYGDSSLLWK